MYRALYRKWRPATFADVIGQESIVTALQSQLLHDKVGHAYLFTGTRGTGKTTCAKIFAKAVNCENRNGANPCCECSLCKGIENGSIMDVVEIDAASNNGVDNIRDLRDETAYTPSAGRYKVYIIDEVHMLSTAAFNALLKIMEEPPSHVIFILATTEIHKVPATIISRCQRYDFVRIAPESIAKRLTYVAGEENIMLSQDAAALIARLADGAMRDALSILDTCAGVSNEVDPELVRRMAGVTDKSYLFSLSDAIAEKDAPGALMLIAQLREKSIDIKRLCDEMVLHYRNLMLAGVANGKNLLSGVSPEEEQRYLTAAQQTPQQEAIRAIKTLSEALDKMGKGTEARIELELAVFHLCEQLPAASSVAAIVAPPQMPPVMQAIATQPQTPVEELPWRETEQDLVERPTAETAKQKASDAVSGFDSKQKEKQQIEPNPAKAQNVSLPLAENPQAATPTQPIQTDAAANAPMEIFAAWDAVLAAMETKDKMLYVNMSHSKAYFDGKRVRIDGSELFMEYMRRNKYSSALIKETIAEVTGTQYPIGPYEKPKKQGTDTPEITAESTLAQLEAQGVPVVYQDK